MTDNWLVKQTLSNVEQWDNSLTTFYPEAKEWMSTPKPYLHRLTVDCNYLNAVKQLDWDKYLVPGGTVLDIGCGGGWLTAYLSAHPKVKKITAIDSSKNYLENFLPEVVNMMNGDMNKVETIQGFFSPVMMDSASVDTIVISSAVHHADNITGVIEEFKRVLKPGGMLIILNETPSSGTRYLLSISKAFVKTLLSVLSRKHSVHVQKISAGGFLYDPYLGDVDYPEWYWKKSIATAGLNLLEVHDSKLATVVNVQGRSLKHFICKK